jgi:hypothetical protein
VIHDPALLERLGAFATERFDGEAFRATRRAHDAGFIQPIGSRRETRSDGA